MATFQFDLVSPEKLLFSGQVDQVDIPGTEGDFGVLAGHAPVIAAIRPGIMTVFSGGNQEKIVVLGGIAEVSAKGLTVLADAATALEDIDKAAFARTVAEMEAAIAKLAEGHEIDKEITRLDQFRSVLQNLEGTALH
jgi:F-type H+-transporting ATPase subunit epsilon